MNGSKSAVLSSGVWGSVLVLVALAIRQFFGVEVSENELLELLNTGIAFFGAFLALIGRIRADRKIDRLL